MFLFCLVFAMFCARLFICALWSPAGKGLTSWLSFVVSTVSLSLSHWYPGSVCYLIVSIPDLCFLTYSNIFSLQFIKIISHYKKIGYNINVLQQTACLVVNPITVCNLAFLFYCTPMGWTSDSMTFPT